MGERDLPDNPKGIHAGVMAALFEGRSSLPGSCCKQPGLWIMKKRRPTGRRLIFTFIQKKACVAGRSGLTRTAEHHVDFVCDHILDSGSCRAQVLAGIKVIRMLQTYTCG